MVSRKKKSSSTGQGRTEESPTSPSVAVCSFFVAPAKWRGMSNYWKAPTPLFWFGLGGGALSISSHAALVDGRGGWMAGIPLPLGLSPTLGELIATWPVAMGCSE
mgnify:CR=1 FL=1